MDNIKLTPISEEMKKSYLDYAMSVIVSRALPDIRDGLKPVQRRIIYAMHKQGLKHNASFAKCAAVVGETMKNYHPHGDAAIYDTLVRMAQPFSLRYPLIEGQGNFGSIDGDPPAAMRYTEARIEKITEELLKDLDKDTVDFEPNYANTTEEPTVLPSRIPNLLINGGTGIAVGMATNIPPHNLAEVCNAIICALNQPEKEWTQHAEERAPELVTDTETSLPEFESTASIDELIEHIKGPDFPTGGIAYDQKEIRNLYEKGKGHTPVRSKTEIEDIGNGKHQIVITELPYQTNKARLVAKIADLVKSGEIEGISDLRDESNREGLRVVIELKRNSTPKRILNNLFKKTELQSTFHGNNVCLIKGQPRTVTLKMVIEEFIRHRINVIVRRTQFDLIKAKEREHILQGLKIALENLDEVIETIKSSTDTDAAKTALMENFDLTAVQSQAILDMQLKRLARLEREKIEAELKETLEIIDELTSILKNPGKVINIIKEETEEVKEEHGNTRKTKIVKTGVGEFADEELIPEEDVVVTITRSGYIKRLPEGTFRRQNRGGKGVKGMETKEGDIVQDIFTGSTHDRVLFFTDTGRVFDLRMWEIPEVGRTARGQAIVNLLEIKGDEQVAAFSSISKEKKNGKYLFLATKNGRVKRTALEEFENVRRTGIIAIGLKNSDKLSWVETTTGEDEILLVTKKGKSIRFNEDDVRPMGRTAQGVRGIALIKEDEVIGMEKIEQGEENSYKVLVVTENGYGKMSNLEDYPTQKRGGKGVLTADITDKTGPIADIKLVDQTDKELLAISANGKVIKLPLEDVSTLGRITQGVRVMKLNKEDSVAAVT